MPFDLEAEKRKRIMDAMAAALNPPVQPPAPQPPGSIQSPQTLEPSGQPYEPEPVRVGFSAKGLSGIDESILKKRALEESGSESKVHKEGDFYEVDPPKKMGKWKALGMGVLAGLASGDPDNPTNALGRAIGGGGLGVQNPTNISDILRKNEIGQVDQDIARGLKLEGQKADVENDLAIAAMRRAKPEQDAQELAHKSQLEIEKLNIERDKAAGLISEQEARRLEREADRRSREEIARLNRESREKIASSKGEDNSAKYDAAQEEFDQLVADEQNAGEEKNRAYAYLEELKKNPNTDPADIAQARSDAQRADTLYKSFGSKKASAKRRMTQNAPRESSQASRKWSVSQWLEANPNGDPEAAKRAAQAKGLMVVE